MALNNFDNDTFVAFMDISGFKVLMNEGNDKAIKALNTFYQTGYDVLQQNRSAEGMFVSDSGVLFVREGGNPQEKLSSLLDVVKQINEKMLKNKNMLTTSIAYGHFKYSGKIEFAGIEKNAIYGGAYVDAFFDSEKGKPKIEPGQCRIIKKNFPENMSIDNARFISKETRNHFIFYWNLERESQIEDFEREYKNSYQRKYDGMLNALSNFISN
jgi:hypothetical protein